MRFSEWLKFDESKFLQMSPEIEGQLSRIIDNVKKVDFQKVRKILQTNNQLLIGNLNLGNSVVPIYFINNSKHAAYYDSNKNIININIELFLKYGAMKNFGYWMAHEIIHSIDPKIKKKLLSQEFKDYVRNYQSYQPIHSIEPAEFDAFGGEVVRHIKNLFSKSTDGGRFMKKQTLDWLRAGGNGPMPYLLNKFARKINLFKNYPELWKQFKVRLANYLL